MRKCSKITDVTNLQQCKETFNLYYFEAGSDFANAMRPSWDQLTYKRIDKIAADKLFVVGSRLVGLVNFFFIAREPKYSILI